jgi:hypothetical protein
LQGQNAAETNDEPSIPNTSIGKLLIAFLEAVNSQDQMRIDSFVASTFGKDAPNKGPQPGERRLHKIADTTMRRTGCSTGLLHSTGIPDNSRIVLTSPVLPRGIRHFLKIVYRSPAQKKLGLGIV